MNTYVSKNSAKICTLLMGALLTTSSQASYSKSVESPPQEQHSSAPQKTALSTEQSIFLDAYLQAWDEKDSIKRLNLIRTFWTKDSIYRDPSTIAIGAEQLNDMISSIQKQYPVWVGSHGKVYSTAEYLWYTWEVRGSENTVLFSGSDVIQLTDNGKAIKIIGFF